jgi:hypothetical protein
MARRNRVEIGMQAPGFRARRRDGAARAGRAWGAAALAAACLVWGTGAAARGEEGKWTPRQVLDHDAAWLRTLGLEIPPRDLWQPAGGGLLEAAVRISGCSASFISASGLLITNHHCAFGILQQHSTPGRDLITHGFLAAGRDQELPGSGMRATLPHRSTDVSAAVEAAAAAAGTDDLARDGAIERKKKELVAECERQESRRCEVATFDGGVRYTLIENLEYPDVRLVFAPPRGIGDFGGEVDNWSWPRHSGDFALLRVYAAPDGRPAAHADANQPLQPPHFFRVAAAGAHPGDFVMVVGYPGVTFRSLIAPEMRERAELYYPRRAALLRAWIDLMEAASRTDAKARIALADRIKGLANSEKNARGQIDGLRRGRVVERKFAADREMLAWTAGQPAAAAYQELAQLVSRRLATWDRDFLLSQARLGPKPLDLALTLVRHAHEAAKSDLEREPAYMDRNRDRLVESLRRDQSRMDPPAEAALLAELLARFAALPEANRLPAVEQAVAGSPRDAAALRPRAQDILERSRVGDLDERLRMFDESAAQLRARRDPLLDLAAGLDEALRESEERDHRFRGAVSRLRPVWQRAVEAHAGHPVAADANGTLRVSFAHVQGYSPRDGVWMEPQTRLAGLVAKQTGEEPFDAPAELVAAAPQAATGPWADPALHDVPVCFLADADTTGGSSGSAVLNGRGELVGVNFDRVWENVANDFGYNRDVARNTSVNVRYMLWVMDALHGAAARPLLDEMGIAAPQPPQP